MAMQKLVVLGSLLSSPAVARSLPAMRRASTACDSATSGFECEANTTHFWGQYSPYFAVTSEIADEVPTGCAVTFVQVLERHGARFPTSKKSAEYAAMIEQIQTGVAATAFAGDFAFLATFSYGLGADDLTAFGGEEAYNSGVQFAQRYGALAAAATPFVRASDSARVVATARNWTAGFQATKGVADPATLPLVIVSEADGANNTLDASTCPAFEASTTGDDAQAQFRAVFVPPIQARVNAALPGANLSDTQVVALMDMCPYETVAATIAAAEAALSPFCALFTDDEWRSYDYYQSLGKFYGHGQGNALGAAQGVGFVNELLARLVGDAALALADDTTVNHTLDAAAATFPVGSAFPLFADFSHDNAMTSIYAAFGFYNQTAPLSNTTRVDAAAAAGYSAAWTVPFSGRVFIEKQTCQAAANATTAAAATDYVRVLMNNRVIPLQNCGADALGRCTVQAFMDSLTFARSGGNWDQCFA